MTVASLRYLDRKQNEHRKRGKDDERIDDGFQPVWHDVPPGAWAAMACVGLHLMVYADR